MAEHVFWVDPGFEAEEEKIVESRLPPSSSPLSKSALSKTNGPIKIFCIGNPEMADNIRYCQLEALMQCHLGFGGRG
ncbi:hypothetical protein LFE_0074 [Leptospirillum ferrooxidans C2-3]|uniref:Uncharacterized protein n=1 Tax=Leptospirillum ferrooxidans (strain C2-3) TaxID=1162668 RepID=I0IKK4_LEPFC|nr:hypothetical protein LFE_0074 [Leptospirillum ferrooxidans C2-3]